MPRAKTTSATTSATTSTPPPTVTPKKKSAPTTANATTPKKATTKKASAKKPTKRAQGQRLAAQQRATAQQRFLDYFSHNANFTAAARYAGVARKSVYLWIETDAPFRARYEEAEVEANDVIRAAITQRAITGIEEPLHLNGRLVRDDQGKPVMTRKYSDTLLIFLAKARMPEFRERRGLEVSGPGGAPIQTQSEQSGSLTINLRDLSNTDLTMLKELAIRARDARDAASNLN